MTDWELKLNANIEQVKNNPEEIKKLIKEYIKESVEEIVESIQCGYEINALFDEMEINLIHKGIQNYNIDLFN